MALFKCGWFKLHSGKVSSFKIECDSLTDEDWDTIALIIAREIKFQDVIGVNRGGLKLAKVLEQYRTPGRYPLLLVDDVLTTGKSMNELRNSEKRMMVSENGIVGVVLFSRGKCPKWITPIFQMDKRWKD